MAGKRGVGGAPAPRPQPRPRPQPQPPNPSHSAQPPSTSPTSPPPTAPAPAGQLLYQEFADSTYSYPPAVWAKGPGVNFTAGFPLPAATAEAVVPGYTALPGRAFYPSAGNLSCGASLGHCVVAGSPDVLAANCSGLRACQAFGFAAEGGLVEGLGRSGGVLSSSADHAARVVSPTSVVFVKDDGAPTAAAGGGGSSSGIGIGGGGQSGGALAGIVVGALAAAMAAAAAAALLLRWRRRRQEAAAPAAGGGAGSSQLKGPPTLIEVAVRQASADLQRCGYTAHHSQR